MKIEDAIKLVERMTFRPGWSLAASYEPRADVLILNVGQMEPDTEQRDPEVPVVPIMYTATAPRERVEAADEATVLRWVLDVLSARLLHEVEEWLRLDGQPVVEPHPEKGWLRGVIGSGRSTELPQLGGSDA